MVFFDYLYYLIYKFYSPKEKGATSSSAGVIGGLQAANVLTVLMLLSFLLSRKDLLNKIYFLVVIILFQITTYIRYVYKDKNSIAVVKERWLNLNGNERTRIKALGLIYIMVSIVASFGLAIFLGSRSS